MRSGSSCWKEFMGTAVALAMLLPILCSMVENGDSRFPNKTPLGKSDSGIADKPGMKSTIMSPPGTAEEPVHAIY